MIRQRQVFHDDEHLVRVLTKILGQGVSGPPVSDQGVATAIYQYVLDVQRHQYHP
jgi:hypothetical protein